MPEEKDTELEIPNSAEDSGDRESSNLIRGECPECGKERWLEIDGLNMEVRCVDCNYNLGWLPEEEMIPNA
ncbi:hypothetical protein AKJ56_00350 [candidate division MSBL1 archaeon SCGC-AAA382N08]|uniref:Uncharacterized protein n=1 Tax=candidate division MSBL1 archaeon SCGC-AAA382N08 TaxID=1698285 RepID=A0A133VQP1_9EURY|nr:hypothetical protein AKJ56_00350 [candidate division MSBL1 archaeon SCGC-AAA382N08]